MQSTTIETANAETEEAIAARAAEAATATAPKSAKAPARKRTAPKAPAAPAEPSREELAIASLKARLAKPVTATVRDYAAFVEANVYGRKLSAPERSAFEYGLALYGAYQAFKNGR